MTDEQGWDTEVELTVLVRVKAKPGEHFAGWQGRTPEDLAITALQNGRSDPSRIDGYVDLVGNVYIDSVEAS